MTCIESFQIPKNFQLMKSQVLEISKIRESILNMVNILDPHQRELLIIHSSSKIN